MYASFGYIFGVLGMQVEYKGTSVVIHVMRGYFARYRPIWELNMKYTRNNEALEND